MSAVVQTELGEMPTTWRVMPVGEYLIEAQYGLSAKGEEIGAYPILRMTNQVSGRISTRALQYVDISDNEAKKFRLRSGDILFNRTNSFELVGRTSLFDIDGDYVFASYLIRLRTIAKELDPRYLDSLFKFRGDSVASARRRRRRGALRSPSRSLAISRLTRSASAKRSASTFSFGEARAARKSAVAGSPSSSSSGPDKTLPDVPWKMPTAGLPQPRSIKATAAMI